MENKKKWRELCDQAADEQDPFAIGIFNPARQSHRPVVRQHVAIEWIQSGIIEVGMSTPSRKLSSTAMRVLPPSRRKALSCSAAQIRELERKVKKRTALRLYPSVITNNRFFKRTLFVPKLSTFLN